MFKPDFFDIFGIGVFSFITVVAAWALNTGRPLPRLLLTIILVIGIVGLIVDSTIVYFLYLR